MRPLAALLIFFLFLVPPVFAQSAGGSPSATSAVTGKTSAPQTARLKALVKTLENEKDRGKLVEQLKTLIAAQEAQEQKLEDPGLTIRVFTVLSDRLQKIGAEFLALSAGVARLPDATEALVDEISTPGWREKNLPLFWHLLVALGAALAVYFIVQRILDSPRSRLETRETESFWDRFPTLAARTLLDLLPVAGLFLTGTAVIELFAASPRATRLGETIIRAMFAAGVIMVIARMMLAPAAANLRLIRLRDIDANYLFVWVRRLTYVTIYGFALVEILRHLGLGAQSAAVLLKIIGLFVALMLAVLVLQGRATIAGIISGDEDEHEMFAAFRNRLASVWYVLALFYLAALYLVWALRIENGAEFLFRGTILTTLIFIFSYVAATGLRHATEKVFALRAEVKRRYPSLEARANMYVPLIQRVGNGVIFVIAAFALLEAWGVDAFSWIASPKGQNFIGSLITIGLLIVITVIVWEVTNALVERYLTSSDKVSARAKTLLPLLRTTMLVVLTTLVILVTLSELGLNIGPLLAGAGVVGLAIGFGAQTLVKDIITGIFILTEDQIAVGDVVRIGTHSGLVEQLTLRTIRLRDLAGNVHIIPFSEVTTVENMTKDFSRYVFEVGVAYREDTDEVAQILYDIADELQADEVYGPLIVAPFEVMGVDSFGDNAVNIRARITTQPIQQWKVGREFNRRMKKRFDELGIEIPFPHRTLYFGVDKDGNAPEGRIALVQPKSTRSSSGQSGAASVETSDVPTPGSGGDGAPDGE